MRGVVSLLCVTLLACILGLVSGKSSLTLIQEPGEDCRIFCTLLTLTTEEAASPWPSDADSKLKDVDMINKLIEVYTPRVWRKGPVHMETRSIREHGLKIAGALWASTSWPTQHAGWDFSTSCRAGCTEATLDTCTPESDTVRMLVEAHSRSASSVLHRLAQRQQHLAKSLASTSASASNAVAVKGGIRGPGFVYVWRFTAGGVAVDTHYKIGQSVGGRALGSGCASEWATRIRESIDLDAMTKMGRNYEILKVFHLATDALNVEGLIHKYLANTAGIPRLYTVIGKTAAKLNLKSGYTEVFDIPTSKLPTTGTSPPTTALQYVTSIANAQAALIDTITVVCEQGVSTGCAKCT